MDEKPIRVALHTAPVWVEGKDLDADTRLFLARCLEAVVNQAHGPGYGLTPDPGSAPPTSSKPSPSPPAAPTRPMPKGPCSKCKTMSWVPNGTGWKCAKCRP